MAVLIALKRYISLFPPKKILQKRGQFETSDKCICSTCKQFAFSCWVCTFTVQSELERTKQKMNPTTENMHGKIIQANQTSHCCIYLPVVFLFLQLIFTQSYFHYWQGYHILNKLRTDHLLYSAKG